MNHSRKSSSCVAATLATLALASAGCVAAPDEGPPGLRREAIVDGELDHEHGAVVALVDPSSGKSFCSGTLVAPGVVLTAAHCVPPNVTTEEMREPEDVLVFFGPEVGGPGEHVHVTEGWVHEAYTHEVGVDDVALLRLEELGPVAPIPPSTSPPAPGDEVTVAGFGYTTTEGHDAGTRRMGTASVHWVGADDLMLLPAPSNTCYGDSGGPTLVETASGLRVAGVHSQLIAECGREAIDTRVDAYVELIARFVLAGVPSCAEGDGCVEGCAPADPDCPCEEDGACGEGCGGEDSDCLATCEENGVCGEDCGGEDPDCPCSSDGLCEEGCESDPDCDPSDGECLADGLCDETCAGDPDCRTFAVRGGGGCSVASGAPAGTGLASLLARLALGGAPSR